MSETEHQHVSERRFRLELRIHTHVFLFWIFNLVLISTVFCREMHTADSKIHSSSLSASPPVYVSHIPQITHRLALTILRALLPFYQIVSITILAHLIIALAVPQCFRLGHGHVGSSFQAVGHCEQGWSWAWMRSFSPTTYHSSSSEKLTITDL